MYLKSLAIRDLRWAGTPARAAGTHTRGYPPEKICGCGAGAGRVRAYHCGQLAGAGRSLRVQCGCGYGYAGNDSFTRNDLSKEHFSVIWFDTFCDSSWKWNIELSLEQQNECSVIHHSIHEWNCYFLDALSCSLWFLNSLGLCTCSLNWSWIQYDHSFEGHWKDHLYCTYHKHSPTE